MKKRGQVGIFVIVGIVIVAAIFLVFFFRESLSKTIRESPADVQEYLNQQLGDIKREIGRCVDSETRDAAKLLIENGGVFNREFNYVAYSGIRYPILCRAMAERDGCLAEYVSVSEMQGKLDKYLPVKINNCLDFSSFENKDYGFVSGNIESNTLISDDNILVTLNFPVELKKDVHSAAEERFVYSVDIPLGELAKTANQLVQKKASGEDVDPISFGILSRNKYRLEVKKPYPDELYDLSLNSDDESHFYFAFEGIPREGFERTADIR